MMTPWILAPLLVLSGPVRSDAAARAEAAFEAGDYDEAAAAASEAYAAEGDPVFLYVQAQAERFGGHCESAIPHYREFIEAVPASAATKAARDNIEECEQALAEVPIVSPVEIGPEPAPPDPIDPIPIESAESSESLGEGPSPSPAPIDSSPRWIRDPWGGAFVGVGVVALGVGGGLYGQARVDAGIAREVDDVVTYGERIDRAYVLSRVGVPMLAAGGGLVVAGVVRWIVVAKRGSRRHSDRVALRPGGFAIGF